MNITPATQKDLKAVWGLIRKEFPYVKLSQEEFLAKHGTEFIEGFAAKEKGKLVGYVEVEFLQACRKYACTRCARINAVVVKEKHRSKGIGSMLLQHALDYLASLHMEKAVLLVERENARTKKWYAKHGFEKHGAHGKKLGGKSVEELVVEF